MRALLRAAQKVRLLVRRRFGIVPRGAHAIPLTARGTVVLVRLTYAGGWRLPGGGIGRHEPAEAGLLRELREEIGMTGFQEIVPAEDPRAIGPAAAGMEHLFLVRGVEYRPRRTLEIDAVREFALDRLPSDLSPRTARLLRTLANRR